MSSFIHGTAPGIQGGDKLIASLKYLDFAPQTCVCLGCLNSTHGQSRTYARAWDNRLEINRPISPFMCLTMSDQCVADNVQVLYYDRHPFRSVYYLGCIPLTCCGPPVIFVESFKCFNYDLSPCFGADLRFAHCNCFNLRQWLVCGLPCYAAYAYPLIASIPRQSDEFLVPLKKAVEEYQRKHNIPKEECAIFTNVTDQMVLDGLGGHQVVQ